LTARFRTSGGKWLDFPVMKKRSVSMSANALIMVVFVNILFMNVNAVKQGGVSGSDTLKLIDINNIINYCEKVLPFGKAV
jgi:hypothetical protein